MKLITTSLLLFVFLTWQQDGASAGENNIPFQPLGQSNLASQNLGVTPMKDTQRNEQSALQCDEFDWLSFHNSKEFGWSAKMGKECYVRASGRLLWNVDLGSDFSCLPTIMRIIVDLTKNLDLVASEMHLVDSNCKATESNATHVRFDIPFDGCGTARDGSHPDYIVFSNAAKWSPKPVGNQLQTRKYDFESRIICRYDRNGSASVSIRPVEELVVSQIVYGKFSFSMEVYETEERQVAIDRTLPLIPGTPLHFRVQVSSSESALILHLDKCWARNRDFSGSRVFIEKGCDNNQDQTLDYKCANSSIQDFQIAVFRILNSPDNFVFFFCDVIVCLETANASLCTDRCNDCSAGSTARRRRSLDAESGGSYDPGSKTFSLVIGPYLVKEQNDGDLKNQKDDEETEVKGTQLSSTMIIVLCVTIIVAIALICATIVVVVSYKRWSAKQKSEQLSKPNKPKVLKL